MSRRSHSSCSIAIMPRSARSASGDLLPPNRVPTQRVALTNEAAQFLVKVPVRAFGTDAYSVDAVDDSAWPNIHHSFLSRGIPVYEELLNIDKLLSKQRLYFVGVPLNIKSGDGMMVRPVVFAY